MSNLERERERLEDQIHDIEREISTLESRLQDKECELEDLRGKLENLEVNMTFADMDEEEEAALEGEMRQQRYLYRRYGTDRVDSIRDYWVRA